MENVIKYTIKTYRIARDLSQLQLAQKLGVDLSTVKNWENGVTTPNCAMICPICRVLSVDPNLLLGFNIEDMQALKEMQDLERYVVSEAVPFIVYMFNAKKSGGTL